MGSEMCIRDSYERAKLAIAQTQPENTERIQQIDDKIKQLQADRELWIKETASRAKLKKLEFDATIEERIRNLEDKVNAISQQLSEGMKRLDGVTAALQNNYQILQSTLSRMRDNMSRQLRTLEERVQTNRELLYRSGWYPRYLYIPPPILHDPDKDNNH